MDSKSAHSTRSQRLFHLISTPLRLSVLRKTVEVSSSQEDGKEMSRRKVTVSRQLTPLGAFLLLVQLTAFLIWLYYRFYD